MLINSVRAIARITPHQTAQVGRCEHAFVVRSGPLERTCVRACVRAMKMESVGVGVFAFVRDYACQVSA